MSDVEIQLVALDVPAGAEMESQSGLQMARPRIYGALSTRPHNKVAAVIMHPTSNFLGHYLLTPLASQGVDLLGLNSRYVNNDSTLIMERVIQDLGAGVRFLRARGYKKVFLIGNSGGAGLVSFYQAQAERLTVTATPAGDPIEINPSDLPPADGIALVAGHLGRPALLAGLIDPSVIDEVDAIAANPELDMYDPQNGPSFTPQFISKYRQAQLERMRRITQRARDRLSYIRQRGIARDEAMIVYRTYADPRYIDLALDPNDRKPGGTRGADPKMVNYGPNTLGRFCTLTSWLSQWSPESNAKGPEDLSRTSVRVFQIEYTADAAVFPSATSAWAAAAAKRIETQKAVGGNHYLSGQPELLAQVSAALSAWMND